MSGALLVGAACAGVYGRYAGDTYVVFGSAGGFGTTIDGAGRSVLDPSGLGSAQGFIIRGETDHDYASQSVASAGDVNGDGYADIIIGAPFADDRGTSTGEARVVFGSAGLLGADDGYGHRLVDVLSLAAGQGFVIQGVAGGDQAGFSVSCSAGPAASARQRCGADLPVGRRARIRPIATRHRIMPARQVLRRGTVASAYVASAYVAFLVDGPQVDNGLI